MKGGDRTSGKYAQRQRSDGRYYLPDMTDELVCHLTVQGESDNSIIKLVKEINEDVIDAGRIEEVRSTLLAQRRMEWLKKEKVKDDYEPVSPQDCVLFAQKNLIRMLKSKIETKDKINANKALVEVSLKQIEMKPAEGAKAGNSALAKLTGGQ